MQHVMRFSVPLLAAISLLVSRAATFAATATLVSKDNVVEIAAGAGAWSAATAGQSLNTGARLRTGEESRAVVRMGDGSVLQLDELTTIEIKPGQETAARETIGLPSGAAFFLNRSAGREVRIETPSANGAIRGTAFLIKVDPVNGHTAVSMMQGAFELANAGGSVITRAGEQGGVSPMSSPAKELLNELGGFAPWYLVIEHDLPSVRSLHSVGRGEFFGALPASIKQWRNVSPQLSGSATIIRREWARDILRSAFQAVGPDCPLLTKILRSVVAADPSEASALTHLAIELMPQCAEQFKNIGIAGEKNGGGDGAGGPAPNPGFGNSTIAGGGGQGNVIAICHNGRTLFLSPGAAQQQLQKNPGDTFGPCQVTPAQNQ
jgi:FecR protein